EDLRQFVAGELERPATFGGARRRRELEGRLILEVDRLFHLAAVGEHQALPDPALVALLAEWKSETRAELFQKPAADHVSAHVAARLGDHLAGSSLRALRIEPHGR